MFANLWLYIIVIATERMIMNILFLHKTFPGQFKYLTLALARNPNSNVFFITEDKNLEIEGVTKLVYKPINKILNNCNPNLVFFEEVLTHAQPIAKVARELKAQGFKPDVIYAFSFWGAALFMKDIFPDAPLITYFEWFDKAEGADVGFDGNLPDDAHRERIRCRNANALIDLYSCDAAISPTYWQKAQFPKEFQDKITVIHDGIDTEICKPDSSAKLFIKDKNIELGTDDEVITYGTRGMEPYRGFPEFMEATEKLLKKRPKAHVVIAGVDEVYYGAPLPKGTYKELMLKKLDLDMSRIHFIGGISLVDYVKFLQISSAHVYSTYPFILSWSILNAMACGCPIIASDTAPVQEVIKDNYNGLLFDFFNVDQLVEKIEYSLDNKDKMQAIRNNARQTVLDNYDVKKLIFEQVNFINSVIIKHKSQNQGQS